MTRDVDTVAGEMTREAIALADDLFPARQRAQGLPDDIRVPVALLARCVSIAKTSLHLAALDTQLDAYVCLRSLYEHTVMLAWLLGPQSGRLEGEAARRILLWERHCDEQTATLGRELAAAGAGSSIPDDMQAAVDAAAAVDMRPGRLPSLADRAVLADREWDSRVREIDQDRAFLLPLQEFYTRTYRSASAVAHPTLASLQFVTTRTPDAVEIHLERHAPGLPVLAAVPVFLAHGYLTTAHLIREPPLSGVAALVRSFGSR